MKYSKWSVIMPVLEFIEQSKTIKKILYGGLVVAAIYAAAALITALRWW
jgi:hypothetical protein